MATLAEEIRGLLASIQGDAANLPVLAPQSVQSGNPTPQNVGQTLGPQPGEARNATRQEVAQDFGNAAIGFGATAADPLRIPSALLGLVAPEARDAWRGAQEAGGLAPQIAGGLATGLPLALGAMRGGSAMAARAGLPEFLGSAGGGAAVNAAAPLADIPGGAQGASGTNAMIHGMFGAAPGIGQGIGQGAAMLAQPVMNALARPGVVPAAAAVAGLGALGAAGGGADAAQQPEKKDDKKKAPRRVVGPPPTVEQLAEISRRAAEAWQPPPLTDAARGLHSTNPQLQSLYDTWLAAARAAAGASAASLAAHEGPHKNTEAGNASTRLQKAAEDALRAYQGALGTSSSSYRENMPWLVRFAEDNPIASQFAAGALLGVTRGAGNAFATRYNNRPINAMIDRGNNALASTPQNVNLAQQASAGANAAQNSLEASGPGVFRRVFNALTGPAGGGLAGGEMALLPYQYAQRKAPAGSAEQTAANDFFRGWDGPWAVNGLRGVAAGIGGNIAGYELTHHGSNLFPGGQTLRPQVDALRAEVRTAVRNQGRGANGPPVQYTGQVVTDFRNTVASAVENGTFHINTLLGRINSAPTRTAQLRRALGEVEADIAAAAGNQQQLTQIAQRVRSGGYRNLAITGAAAGTTAHHSLSQPRGDDGRFVGDE